jgi:hypothetical protein
MKHEGQDTSASNVPDKPTQAPVPTVGVQPEKPWPRPDDQEPPEEKTVSFERKIVHSRDRAVEQVQLLLDRYAIIPVDQTAEDKKALEALVNKIISYVMYDFLEIKYEDEELVVIQHLKNLRSDTTVEGRKITYGELEGEKTETGSGVEDITHFGNVTFMMGKLCKDLGGPEIVKKLKSADRAVMLKVGDLFLSLLV